MTSAAPVSPAAQPGEQPAATAAVMERPHQLDQAASARGRLRVTVDQAAAERVHRVDVRAGLAREPEVVDRERVVGLDHVDVREREPGVGECGGGRWDRGLGHLTAPDASEAAGQDPGSRAVGGGS